MTEPTYGRQQLRGALRSPTGLSASIVLLALVLLAIFGPIVWGEAAARIDVAHILEGSSARHLLGTDNLGHDILARLLVATRPSLTLALLATGVAALIGVPMGALPAVVGPRAARIVNAVIEFSVAFPSLLLAIFLAVILGVGSTSAVLAIGVASAPSAARLTQTLVASVAGSDYVAAARLLGVPWWKVLWRHVLPNVGEPLILNLTLAVGQALLALSGLSFLGLGVQAPAYDWGRMLDEGLSRVYLTPIAALAPGAAIVLAGLAFNGLGEALAQAVAGRSGSRRVAPARVDGGGEHVPEVGAGKVLDVAGLSVRFPSRSGPVVPVRDVSFSLERGERVGIVGESGSGKSLTALAIGGLVPSPGEVDAERLRFLDRPLAEPYSPELRRLLGTSLAMVFQDPGTSLNPSLTVGRQLAEVAEVHRGTPRRSAFAQAVDRLRQVRIANPERRVRQYPHELSGGMRQRAMIAMGLMGEPALIIADEPTSALDVTVQQQILRLLHRISSDTGTALLLISHDIAVVSQLCQRVLVMYAGRIVEDLPVAGLPDAAAHPYTRALIASLPDMATPAGGTLASIPGRPPEPNETPAGCPFAPRCAFASDRCVAERPELTELRPGQRAACWHPQLVPTFEAMERVR